MPTTIDVAVQSTLEIESYVKPLSGKAVQLVEESMEVKPVVPAGLQKTCDMRMLLEKMEKMEAQLKELQQPAP